MTTGIRIGITGDTHGDLNFQRIYKAKRMGITDLIICGDFGYIWDGSLKEQRQIDYMSKIGVNIYFIDGNHEAFPILNSYPIEEKFGGRVHKVRENIFHLMRGEVYTINNKKFFAFGGANSTDKEWRVEGKTWWREEKPSEEEKQYARDNLKKHGNKVDYILTHTCYPVALDFVGGDWRIDEVADFLNEIKHIVDFDYWFFGHIHVNFNILDLRTRCLYRDIIQLD